MFDELNARGLIKQTTNADKLQDLLDNKQITFYIGFDPTADSLHVGHLLQLLFAQRMIDKGHKAILLVGGATASVGDPTGKTDMRKMLASEDIERNGQVLRQQFEQIVQRKFLALNNLSFFEKMSFLEMLAAVGPHFSVNNMLRADCFKSRMEHGLSFLEFNYMIMQSWDFFCLHSSFDCSLQVGGDDQWSNMLGGIELIRRKSNQDAIALTLPLLVNANGQKMGKTEKGTVWLDANKTSVNDFFQFWRNIPDADVKKCFMLLTDVPVDSIETEMANALDNPGKINALKKALADIMTRKVHGESEAKKAAIHAESLFENKDSSAMESHPLEDNLSVLEIMIRAGFAKSKTEGRNLISGKGFSINDKTIEDPTVKVSSKEFGKELVVRKGKKNFFKFNIS